MWQASTVPLVTASSACSGGTISPPAKISIWNLPSVASETYLEIVTHEPQENGLRAGAPDEGFQGVTVRRDDPLTAQHFVEPIDVHQIDADVLICSPYKFCGPHLGMAYGRTEVIERWRPYKARPAPTSPLGRSFETGTQSYELLAGFNATIDYLDSIGGFAAIVPYERSLGQRFLDGLPDAVTVYGRPGMDGRVPTFLVNVEGVPAADVAARLADEQIGVWAHDSWYSLGLYQRLGYTGKSIRIGFIHYNSVDEVDRLLEALNGVALSR